jgi:hypothetical protein
MSRLCNLRILGFSEETKLKLRAAYAENPSALLSDYCQGGRHEVAKNKAGEWVPGTHEKPAKRPAYKGGGYKRNSK